MLVQLDVLLYWMVKVDGINVEIVSATVTGGKNLCKGKKFAVIEPSRS